MFYAIYQNTGTYYSINRYVYGPPYNDKYTYASGVHYLNYFEISTKRLFIVTIPYQQSPTLPGTVFIKIFDVALI